jgi:phenylacetate-CoA ligase
MSMTLSHHAAMSLDALESALQTVPAYAAWRAFDPGRHVPVDLRYAALPVLTKQELRAHFPDGFIPRERDLHAGLAHGDVEFAKTSGSPDDQVTLVFHAPWWEASERAAWTLNRHARAVATGTHREAVLASPRCVGPGFSERPLPTADRTLGRHLYLNEKPDPATWTDDDVGRMAAELDAYRPVVLEADPAYLAPFARGLQRAGLTPFQPALIFLTYSYPSRAYLRRIRRMFTAPIASSYGSTETGHVFMECEAGRLHQNTAHCRVDIEPWAPRYGGPLLGRMLVTVFHNPWFAVLRFDIGDVARLEDRGPCPCGRTDGLTLAAIEGRTQDVSFTPGGNAVTVDQLDRSLCAIEALEAWQLDLRARDDILLRVQSDPGSETRVREEAKARIQEIYGAHCHVEIPCRTALEAEASGKFRFVRSLFPVDHTVLYPSPAARIDP